MDTTMHDAFFNELCKAYEDYRSALPSNQRTHIPTLPEFKHSIEEVVIFENELARMYIYEVMLDEYSDMEGFSGLFLADFFIQVATFVVKKAEKIANKELRTLKDVGDFLNELESILDRPLSNLEEFSQDEWSLIELNYHH